MGNESEKIITCERSQLFPGTRELIARSEKLGADNFPLQDRLDWIEGQIDSGQLLLYRVKQDGECIGIITGVVEREFGHPSNFLIIHAVSMEQQPEPFICTLFPVIHNLISSSGLKSWTVRSMRLGMDKRLEQHGFVKTETVYKRPVE